MRYFANPSTPLVREAMNAGLLDCIITPKQGLAVPPNVRYYCADNGVFGKGYPGDDRWWAWAMGRTALEGRERCAFVVAPDVVGDASATLTRSLLHMGKVRSLGVPVAYVAQDGLHDTEIPWDEFDVLFIGGSTEFKLGVLARVSAAQALSHGKTVHMGRVNSYRRLQYASDIGCASADGTYIKFGPDINLPKVLGWLQRVNTGESITAIPGKGQ